MATNEQGAARSRQPGDATAANAWTGQTNSTRDRWPAHGFGDRLMGNVELLSSLEAVEYLEAALSDLPEPLTEAEAYDVWALTKIRQNIEAEIAKRERLFAAGHAVAAIREARHDQWLDLARQVRERGNIFDVLCRIGHAPAGPNRNGQPAHGSCPFCPDRGFDRFISWHSETAPDRFYCRRCGSTGDIITLVRETMPGCDSFYRAVGYLAADVGLALPTEAKPAGKATRTADAGSTFEYRAGQVVQS